MMEKTFTKEDLPDLQDDLFSVREKWYDIGLRIGLTSDDLDPIKAQYKDDFKDCLPEMLKLRLSRARPLSRNDIILALRKPSIEKDSLAAKLERKYTNSSDSSNENHSTPSPTMTPTDDEVFSSLDKVPHTIPESQVDIELPVEDGTNSVRLEFERAKKEKEVLHSTFTQIVLEIKAELKIKIGVAEFRDKFLLGLSISLKTEHTKYFEQNLQKLVDQTTYDGLFGFLNYYWGYLNYNLLELIVKKYGSSIIKRKMGQFCADIKQFRKSTTLSVFWEIEECEVLLDPPVGFRLAITEHHITPESTLEDVNKVRLRVTREFHLQEFALYIEAIVKGSVFITWLVPHSVISVLKCGLTAQLLDELHIETITFCPSTLKDTKTDEKNSRKLIAASKSLFGGGHNRVKALLELGVNPNTRSSDDKYGRTPLMWASFRSNLKIVETLLTHPSSSHIEINAQDSKGWTAFMLACEKESDSIANLLLRNGANINLQNAEGWSALMRAAYTGKLRIAQILLEIGADTEVKDRDGWTALMAASQKGNKKVVQILLGKANPNAMNERGMTALMSASQQNHLDIVKLLKQHGAMVNLQRKDGVTALHIACDRNNSKVVDELYHTEGIELNVEDEDQFTPLMIASKNGNGNAVKILLGGKEKADHSKKAALGWTALFLAVKEGKTDIVEALLRSGADPAMQDSNNHTVLDIANDRHKNKKIYKLLVNAMEQTGKQQTTFQDPNNSVTFIEEVLRHIGRRFLPGIDEKRKAQSSHSEATPEQTTVL